MQALDDDTALRSLNGRLCPACGKEKRRSETLCQRDYFRLTRELQFALYRRVGNGYGEAVADALSFLGVAEPHLAEPAQAPRMANRTEPDVCRPGGRMPPAGLFDATTLMPGEK